jgi:hypothetical protein
MIEILQGIVINLASDWLKALIIPAIFVVWKFMKKKTFISQYKRITPNLIFAILISPIITIPFICASFIWFLPIIAFFSPRFWELGYSDQFSDSILSIISGIVFCFTIYLIFKRLLFSPYSPIKSFVIIFLDGSIIVAIQLAIGILYLISIAFFQKIDPSIWLFSMFLFGLISIFAFWVGCFLVALGPLSPQLLLWSRRLHQFMSVKIKRKSAVGHDASDGLGLAPPLTSETPRNGGPPRPARSARPPKPTPAHPASALDR